MSKTPRIKDCVITNPPVTLEEQEEYGRKVAKTLATALSRSLGAEELEHFTNALRKAIEQEKSKPA